ncbi:glucokinase [Cyanobium sp. Alchichica 3B3-8F6]|uniref:glucokinase n=1 Tax=Cyanobium sp. Alchichica 3B3-8F6 TaxID=2823696 RepID=UPI0020CCF858|nr:glucokinase [Cyanobium sp. Alchichica 3B3-8F6]MCP9882560.1 glucokinase [Cyanobium sp. Alchichica 3B3-8F6]
MTTLLAGDIGGTKTLLALYALGEKGNLSLLGSERYSSADWDDLAPMVRAFLAAGSHQPPAAACLAVAGPVEGGQAQLTNLSWQLDEARLASATGIGQVALVNDFAVLIYGLPHLAEHQQAPIRPGRPRPEAPLLVLGAGTGLGVAYGVPTPSGLVAMASEAAHGEFAPRSQAEWELKQWLAAARGLERVSIERVVSGTGLGEVARWLLASRHPDAGHPLSALVDGDALPAAVAAAAARGDALAGEALALWISCYGSVCGDLALAGLSRGGVWLAGGTAAKLLAALQSPGFTEAFLRKGRLAAVLADMPITAVLDAAIGQFSAACRARMLVA